MSITNIRTGRSDGEARNQVEQFATQARELRERLRTAQSNLEGARVAFAGNEGSATAVAEAVNERDRIKQQLEDVEAGRRQLLGQLAPGSANGAGGHGIDPSGVLADQLADPEFAEVMRGIALSKSRFGDIELGRIDRDALVRIAGGSLQAATGGLPVLTPGMTQRGEQLIPMIQPATTFLDLVPTNTIDYPTLPYAQEIAETGDPGPAPAAPGTTKPAAGVGYEDATTASTTVAGWVR